MPADLPMSIFCEGSSGTKLALDLEVIYSPMLSTVFLQMGREYEPCQIDPVLKAEYR